MASTAILQAARGQPPKKRVRRTTVQLQSRLLKLCVDRRDGLSIGFNPGEFGRSRPPDFGQGDRGGSQGAERGVVGSWAVVKY